MEFNITSDWIPFAGLLLCVPTIIYRNKLRAVDRELQQIKKDHASSLLRSRIETEEQTLQAVSRDIHDNISLGLTISKLHLHALNTSYQHDVPHNLELSISLIGDAIQSLRDLSRSLNPDMIKYFGLSRAIENEIGILRQTRRFTIEYTQEGTEVRPGEETEIVLFRMVQEALNNIIKHAEAKRIRISVRFVKNLLEISISDNGKGFDHPQNEYGGCGLLNMKQRALFIGCDCQVSSFPGKGTMIRMRLPLKIKNETRTT